MTSHDPITPAARELFDRASSRLDQDVASRLRRARRDALAAPAPRSRAMMVPAGAFAAAVLALGLAWWMPPASSPPDLAQDNQATAEIDALMADEDADLYAWLAEAPVATGEGAAQ
jgi:ferric-dicitrate binding protein FerR (iron transport regulator)